MIRLLAVFAFLNRYLQTWSVNWVTFDKLYLALGSIACLLLLNLARVEGSTANWFAFAVVATVVGFSLLAACRHNTIFMPIISADAPRLAGEVISQAGLFVSGKLSLWEGQSTRFDRILDRLMYGRRPTIWFYRVPCELIVDAENDDLFVFVSDLDMSVRLLGVAVDKRAGMWNAAGKKASVEQVERGELLNWWTGESALELVFRNSRDKRTRLVLSSHDPEIIDTCFNYFSRS